MFRSELIENENRKLITYDNRIMTTPEHVLKQFPWQFEVDICMHLFYSDLEYICSYELTPVCRLKGKVKHGSYSPKI